jgi:hypothetical protein
MTLRPCFNITAGLSSIRGIVGCLRGVMHHIAMMCEQGLTIIPLILALYKTKDWLQESVNLA